MRCVTCKSGKMVRDTGDVERQIAGRTFKATVPVLRCNSCDEEQLAAANLAGFELAAAEDLARNGPSTGEAFRFMRKALGLAAGELAELMDVAPETVSRWENDKLPVERRAMALLGAMIADRIDGRATTLDRLRALRAARRPPATVRLTPRPA